MVSFHLPQAAETFVRGLFMNQQVEIADKKSRCVFTIVQVESIPTGLTQDERQEVILQPLSAMVCGQINENGHYDFLSPEHPEFVPQLMYNWKEKYKTLNEPAEVDVAFNDASMEVLLYRNPPKSRLITVKADTPSETKIRGFVNFELKVRGQRDALELLMDSGAGIYNSLGMGYLSF
jgi:CRISPR-associated endoribonuclease Cas6